MTEANAEKTIWKGRSSHWTKAHVYLLCAICCWAIVPIYILINRWLQVHCRVYELTTERLHVTTGVLSKLTQDLELYRIKDITLVQPALMRVVKLGNVVLTTTDQSTPTVVIEAVRYPVWLRDQIRKHVEKCRLAKGVRQVDFADTPAPAAAAATDNDR